MSIYFITGISSGIGKALASQLVDDGHFVVGVARSTTMLSELSQKLKSERLEYHSIDICDHIALIELKESLIKRNLYPDYFILNAGISPEEDINIISVDLYSKIFRTNYLANVDIISMWLPSLVEKNKSAWFYATSSVNSLLPAATFAGYGSSKAALNYLFDSLDLAYSNKKIRFGYFLPGPVNTPLWGGIKVKRMIEPDDAASYMLYQIDKKSRKSIFPFFWRVFTCILKIFPYKLSNMLFRA